MTEGNQNKLLFSLSVMFNGTLGRLYYDQLYKFAESDDYQGLVDSLSLTGAFESIYPASLSSDEFCSSFINNLAKSFASESVKQWAINAAITLMNDGAGRSDIVTWAFNGLNSIDASHPSWGGVRAYIDNTVEVSRFYSLEVNQSSNSLSVLQAVFAGITADADSVQARIDDLKIELGIVDNEVLLNLDPDISPITNVEFLNNAPVANTSESEVGAFNSVHVVPDEDGIVALDGTGADVVSVGEYGGSTDIYITVSDEQGDILDNAAIAWSHEVAVDDTPGLEVVIGDGANLVYDASGSTFGTVYTGGVDSPLFTADVRLRASESAVIKTGDANTIVTVAGYRIDGDAIDPMEAFYDSSSAVIEFGNGFNALAIEKDMVETLDFGNNVSYQDTVVYGFDENDYVFDRHGDTFIPEDALESSVYESWSELQDYIAVVNGNTVINAPGDGRANARTFFNQKWPVIH